MQPMGLRVVPYTPEVSCNLVCKSQIQVPARGQHCLFYLHKLHRSSGNFEGDSRLIPMQEGGKHSCYLSSEQGCPAPNRGQQIPLLSPGESFQDTANMGLKQLILTSLLQTATPNHGEPKAKVLGV